MGKPKNKISCAELSLPPLVNLSSLSNAHMRECVNVCKNEGGGLPIYTNLVTDLKPKWDDLFSWYVRLHLWILENTFYYIHLGEYFPDLQWRV